MRSFNCNIELLIGHCASKGIYVSTSTHINDLSITLFVLLLCSNEFNDTM